MTVEPFNAAPDVVRAYPAFFAEHRRNGVFFNPWQNQGLSGFGDMLRWQLGTNPWKGAKRGEEPVAADSEGLDRFLAAGAAAKVLWLGQAGFLGELDGIRFLVDPVYGTVGAFAKRFGQEPFSLEALPEVDVVFLSHGHYDHLDVQTLRAVAVRKPETIFVVPLGQGRYLPSECREIVEIDWWQQVRFGEVTAVFVPAQHWHRRGPFDQNRALWGGWVFCGSRTLYHSGDTGHCEVFRLLGELFDIDLAMLPVGAYEPRWFMRTQHMNPEDALDAFVALGASHFVAMHWGTYDLTDEPLNLGAELIVQLASGAGLSESIRVLPPGGTEFLLSPAENER